MIKHKKMTLAEQQAELKRLRSENRALKSARKVSGGNIRVGAKGGVSVYGLGRFPVTLYKEQWLRLLDMAEDIKLFIKGNASVLAVKADRKAS